MYNDPKVKALIKILKTSSVGKIAMLNFIDAINCGIFSNDVAKKFIKTWAEMCDGKKDIEEIKKICKDVAEKIPNLLMVGKEYKYNPQIELYTVLEYYKLKDRLSSTNKEKYPGFFELADIFCSNFNDRNYEDMEEDEKKILKEQEKLTSGSNYLEIELKSDQYIKHGSLTNLIWFSKDIAGLLLTEDECFKSTSRHLADIARDNLGLSHLGADINSNKEEKCPLLVAVRVKVENKKLFRPTVIDAAIHERFRSVNGDISKKAKESYGRATHLETLSDIKGKLGSMEVVTENFNPSKAELTFLGYPRVPRKDFTGINDDKFYKNIAHNRALDTIVGRFLSI